MKFLHAVLAPVALTGVLFLAGASPVRADDECQKRTANADHKLHEAVEHHGYHSPQAQHWRQELAEARSYCWEHSRHWWDEDSHRWHSDRDWDDHDHDHDMDRDHH
jgi:hypothetical protein